MAKQIVIKNDSVVKRAFTINELLEGLNCKYGSMDYHHCLDLWNINKVGYLVIYNAAHVGRGVHLMGYGQTKEVKLVLSMPATSYDCDLLFELCERIRTIWKTDKVTIDGEKYDVSKVPEYKEELKNACKSVLCKSAAIYNSKEVTMYCAHYPIVFDVDQLTSYGNDYESFATFLNDRQPEAFMSNANIMPSSGNKETAVYVIIDDGLFILPDTPERENSLVACLNISGQGVANFIEFSTFISLVPKDKIQPFDCRHHFYGPLSISELRRIFNQAPPRYKP